MEYRDHLSDYVLSPDEQDRLDLPEIVTITEMNARRNDLRTASEIATSLADDLYSEYSDGGIMGDFDSYNAAQKRASAASALFEEVNSALSEADEAVMRRLAAEFYQDGQDPTQ